MSLRAIARELGVSSTAVSLALKGSSRVSIELQEKVASVARKHGYIPNAQLSELMSEVRRSTPLTYRATLGLISLFSAEDPGLTAPHLRQFALGATELAAKHGYHLEPFWVKQPGMTPARLAKIIETRGIRGLLCLGGQNPEETFPPDFYQFSVVAFATSLRGNLNRVMSHFTADCETLMQHLNHRGYKRPGLITLRTGDRRCGYMYSSTFLGVQERTLPKPHVPILRLESWDKQAFGQWFDQFRPDVLVMHQYHPFILAVEQFLSARRIRIPRDIGIALLDLNPAPARYSGVRQNPHLMGRTAMDLLIARVVLNDFGEPTRPKVELVIGDWNDGTTLRPSP